MAPTPTIRRLRAADWALYRDLRLRALGDSPDAFGSTLASEAQRDDALWIERVAAAQDSPLDAPLIATVDGAPCGMAWGKVFPAEPATAHLFQMWVAPECRRRGAGRLLLGSVIEWAKTTGATRLELGVTCGDTPARKLYERLGFVASGDTEPLRPGSVLQSQTMALALR